MPGGSLADALIFLGSPVFGALSSNYGEGVQSIWNDFDGSFDVKSQSLLKFVIINELSGFFEGLP